MRVFSLPLLVAALWGLAPASPAQTTWYVDVNGTPPGTGSQADPYTSPQFALAQATTVAGDTLLVEPGTYVENLDFLGKDVVVQANGPIASEGMLAARA